jgi:hypothetical protein
MSGLLSSDVGRVRSWDGFVRPRTEQATGDTFLGSGLWALGSGAFGLWALGSGLWALGFGSGQSRKPRAVIRSRRHDRRNSRAIRDFLVGVEHVPERDGAGDQGFRVVATAVEHRHKSGDVAHRVCAAGLAA